MKPLLDDLQKDAALLTRIRRDLHEHPELGYEEVRTAGIVATTLREAGLDVATSIAGTGVVGTLRCGHSNRSIGLTADMDALPMEEKNVFGHRSRNPGRMHACGHDGHTTMLLGAALYLARTRNFDGTVHFIFRPSEENCAGAPKMLQEGLFERFPCDAIYGMHNVANLPQGTLGTRVGGITAGTTVIDIEVKGVGAHAARPHLAIDPIGVAAEIVTAVKGLSAQLGAGEDPVVLVITQISGGSSEATIPEIVNMRGTLRTFSVSVAQAAKERLTALVEKICADHGAKAVVGFRDECPPSICTEPEVGIAVETGLALLGSNAFFPDIEPTMAGDDLSFMLERRPGAFIFIGNGDGEHRGAAEGMGPCIVHNSWFDFNDALLPVGAAYWAALAERYLSRDR